MVVNENNLKTAIHLIFFLWIFLEFRVYFMFFKGN